MLRRTALAAMIAPLAAATLPAMGLTPVPDSPQRPLIKAYLLSKQGKTSFPWGPGHPMMVTTTVRYESRTPEAVVDSMRAGMSAGWPDWETHTNGGGRAQISRMRKDMQQQPSGLYEGYFMHQTPEDIRKAIVDLTDRYDVLLAGPNWDRITRQWKAESRKSLRKQGH